MQEIIPRFQDAMARFGPFETNPHVAVAVSGGADSMALALIAKQWTDRQSGSLNAIHIDHGLRPDSAEEAQKVSKWLDAHTIPCDIIRLDLPNTDSALQENARNARYEALAQWCRDNHILHLLLGHHLDDQRETYLLRQQSGSRDYGLSGMSGMREWHRVRLLRPLLGCEKSELYNYVQSQQQDWLDDPSNRNTYFTRTQLRQKLSHYSCNELSTMNQDIVRMQDARMQSSNQLAELLSNYVTLYNEGFARLELAMFDMTSPEHSIHILGNTLTCISGNYHPPRRHELERLLETLSTTHPAKLTLSGCVIQSYQNKKGNYLLIYREHAAIGKSISVTGINTYLWDNRFSISLKYNKKKCLFVRAIGPDLPKELSLPPHVTPAIARTLPSLWHLDSLLCIPHMGYMVDNPYIQSVEYRFNPAKPLADMPFFAMNRAA